MSVTRGVGQVVLERAVAVVAVKEAEVSLAARKIHDYSVVRQRESPQED